jgi:hypothetical protein
MSRPSMMGNCSILVVCVAQRLLNRTDTSSCIIPCMIATTLYIGQTLNTTAEVQALVDSALRLYIADHAEGSSWLATSLCITHSILLALQNNPLQ